MKPGQQPTVQDTGFEMLEADPQQLAEMVADKTKENTALLNRVAELERKNTELINRTMKVHTESAMLKASPETAAKMAEMEYDLKIAQYFVDSGAFPKDLNPAKAFILMKAGKEMGFGPMESIASLYIVNGQVKPFGKAMTAIFARGGYELTYTDETTERVTCTATNPKTGHTCSETVSIKDPILKKSKAMGFAPRQKLRYHAQRMIMSFHLAHLFGGVADPFPTSDTEDIEYQEINPRDVAKVEESKERARLIKIISKARTVRALEAVKRHRVTHDLVTEYDAKLAELTGTKTTTADEQE